MEEIVAHPVSGKSIVGFTIPNWEAAKELAVKGHAMMPEMGVFGWDIGMAQDGPLVIEANVNPYHPIYQLAKRRSGCTDWAFLQDLAHGQVCRP